MRFEPGTDSLDIQLSRQAAVQTENMDRILSIKLTQPLRLVPDEAMLDAVGAKAHHVGHENLFIVRLRSGSKMSGTTRGFVKEKYGLFLFLVEDDSPLATGCFIPQQQIADVNIGPLLGETMIANNLASREAVTTALHEQTQLRKRPIGSYLTHGGIITPKDLTDALNEQQNHPNVRLGDVLLKAGLIAPRQLKEALAIQAAHRERRLGDILVDMGAVTLRQVQVALSEKLGIPFINVREFKVDPLTLEAIDGSFATRHQVLPLFQMGESLVVAVANPLETDFAQDLRFTTGLAIVSVIADPDDLKTRITKLYSIIGRSSDLDGGTSNLTALVNADSAKADLTNVEDLASQLTRETPLAASMMARSRENDPRVSENTLVRLINKIIVEAHAQGASDIHIESNPGSFATRIRFRKDGDLEDYLNLPPAYRASLVSRVKVMADLDIAEHRRPQDGKITFGRFGPLDIELRVAVIPTANNLEDVVLRILGGMQPLPLTELQFSVRDLAELSKMIVRSYGMILVCGPTGSGKTTTLHSILHHINTPDIKIWTAEDPIEITQPGLRQVQVQPKIGWTFAAAMREFLRADPDVIMVGEMRDAETTKVGIEASLTGHLVFSTLHTNSAAETVVRLLDLGMDPFNFADALIGILAQRLAVKLCLMCKRSHKATEFECSEILAEYCNDTKLDPSAVLSSWRANFGGDDGLQLFEAVGCEACHNGYKGRVGVYELLVSTPHIKDLVREGAAVPKLAAAAMEGGMRLLKHDAIDKVWRGILDRHSARAVSA
ncbi:MAG: ATPase, T2SS/T4P/T4SS family [Gammaproteobacteria bacterium]